MLKTVLTIATLASLSGCCSHSPPPPDAADKGLTLRYQWVCESGHTVKRTGPYKSTYTAAAEGGAAHEKSEHEGQSTTTVQASIAR